MKARRDPHCCESMRRYVNDEDRIILYRPRSRRHLIPVHDGGSSGILIRFCPWCGRLADEPSRKEPRAPEVRIVLVRPRNPLNIGASARAMANFGVRDLAVVDPYEPVWREARSAVGAGEVLGRARACALDEALKGCRLVLGTTDGRRKLRRPVLPLYELANWLDRALGGRKGRVAILFGSEKTGLANRELERCHALLSIPTEPAQPSMNLGQALAVVLYELRRGGSFERPSEPADPLPVAEQVADLEAEVLKAFDRAGYMSNLPAQEKARRLREMLLRWRPTRRDLAILLGFLRRVA